MVPTPLAVKIPCDTCVPKVWTRRANVGGALWVWFRGDESSWADDVVKSEYRQKVFVHLARKSHSQYFSQGSELWAVLSEGETYDLPYTGLKLQFCEIIGNTSRVSITQDVHNCAAPTAAPTIVAPISDEE